MGIGHILLVSLFSVIICLLIPWLWRQWYRSIDATHLHILFAHKWLLNVLAFLMPLTSLLGLNYWGMKYLKAYHSSKLTTEYYFAAMLHPTDSILSPAAVKIGEYAGPIMTNTGLHKLLAIFLLGIIFLVAIRYILGLFAKEFHQQPLAIKIIALFSVVVSWCLVLEMTFITISTTVGVTLLNLSPVTSLILVIQLCAGILAVSFIATTISLYLFTPRFQEHDR